jgi:pimeloyl-ACP methyl ester carboxylesterase
MSTFVLVHGAWAGGWYYKRVALRLIKAGHMVYTPTLTGLGERSHLVSQAINLDRHVQDIINVIRWEELSDFILCGHSYGGMVISSVADQVPEKVRALVYLDAFVPNNGHSLMHMLPAEMRAGFADDAHTNGEGYLITPIPAEKLVNERDVAWFSRMCVKHPLACFEQKVSLTGALNRVSRRTYVAAVGPTPPPRPAFVAIADRLRKDQSWKVVDLPCGHSMMLDMPKETAELLIAANG